MARALHPTRSAKPQIAESGYCSRFPAVSTRPVTGPREKITATFDGGTLSSNGGVLILREIEKRLGLATGSARTFLTITMAGVQTQLQRHDAGADVRDCQWP